MENQELLGRLRKLIDVLDPLIGDTEPDVDDLNEDEIIEYEPNYYLMRELVGLHSEIEQEK